MIDGSVREPLLYGSGHEVNSMSLLSLGLLSPRNTLKTRNWFRVIRVFSGCVLPR